MNQTEQDIINRFKNIDVDIDEKLMTVLLEIFALHSLIKVNELKIWDLQQKLNKHLIKKVEDKKRELRFGDIVDSVCGRRVMLRDEKGLLCAYNKWGEKVGGGTVTFKEGFYKYTGQNIFQDDFILNLSM